MPQGKRNKGSTVIMVSIALCMLITGLFFVVASMIPAVAATSVSFLKCKPPQCKPTPTPTHTPTATPTHTPTATPTHTPTPTPVPTHTPTSTPKPNNTPTPKSTSPTNTPDPTATPVSTPISNGSPTPVSTSTAQANLTPVASPTKSPLINNLTSGGGNSGGPSTGIVFTYGALALALVAFLLYLIPQGQSSLLVRLLSLVLPVSLARRFGSR